MLVILRSALFNVLFYLNLLVHFIIAIQTLVMPRIAIVKVATLRSVAFGFIGSLTL